MPLYISSTMCSSLGGQNCITQPPDDEHMCSKHVEAWNKLTVKQDFCASSWLITEINILRCTVSKTSKNVVVPYVKTLDILYIPLPSNKVVLHKYIRSTLVNEHNGEDEPYDYSPISHFLHACCVPFSSHSPRSNSAQKWNILAGFVARKLTDTITW